MSLMSSQFGPDDMEALLWEPSFPMADPLGSLLDQDEEGLPLEGAASPLSSFSSSPLSSLSPPSSPPSSLLGDKVGVDSLTLPWLSTDELCHAHSGTEHVKEDAFTGMDWMAERIDLSEFDLDSLIGSCGPEEPPSSPEELIAALESDMDLNPLPVHTPDTPPPPSTCEVVPLPCYSPPTPIPEPQMELEIKSEPATPVPSPAVTPPPSPCDTLDLGSEVDVSESERPASVKVLQVPRIVLSLPTRIVLLLAPKADFGINPTTVTTVPIKDHSDGDGGIDSSKSPNPYCPLPPRSPRPKPYPSPATKSRSTPELPTVTGKVKSAAAGGTPKVVEKKLKKMEQNKTAATRYRQKKRVEQEVLHTECTELEQKNHELAEKADSIAKEIQYLKDLMDEVRQAKSRKG